MCYHRTEAPGMMQTCQNSNFSCSSRPRCIKCRAITFEPAFHPSRHREFTSRIKLNQWATPLAVSSHLDFFPMSPYVQTVSTTTKRVLDCRLAVKLEKPIKASVYITSRPLVWVYNLCHSNDTTLGCPSCSRPC